MFKYPYKRFS